MSHKHRKTLESIYKEPVSANIHWREVEALLNNLGATIEHTRGARIRVFLNGREGHLHHPHHSGVLSKQDVRHLRGYLASAGVTLSTYQ